MGSKFLRCNKTMTQHNLFMYFLLTPFLPYNDTFTNDYDEM